MARQQWVESYADFSYSSVYTTSNLSKGLYAMRTFTAVVEKDAETNLYVGYVPGFPGAHSQGASLDELQANLREVIEMLLEDGEPVLEGQFLGTQSIVLD